MSIGQLVAFYYTGLLIFGLNGLLIIYQHNQIQKHKLAVERAERLIKKSIRKRGRV